MYVLLITWLLWGKERLARRLVNRTIWVAVAIPTNSPTLVRNCFVIELLGRVLLCIVCRLGVFVIRLHKFSSLFSLCCHFAL